MSFETDRNIYTKRKKRVTKEYSNIGSRKWKQQYDTLRNDTLHKDKQMYKI